MKKLFNYIINSILIFFDMQRCGWCGKPYDLQGYHYSVCPKCGGINY